MSKFLAVFVTLIALTALGVSGFAYYQAWLNQPLEDAEQVAPAEIGDVAGVVAAAGDAVFELTSIDDGGNTQMLWRCGKRLAGVRHDYVGAWTSLNGRALVDPKSGALRAGELHVAVNAMRGHGEHPAPNAMINTVRANQWFAPDHPTAVLRAGAARARAADEAAEYADAIADWTHALACELTLNGVTKELTVYARVAVAGDRLDVDAVFPISRAAYQVAKRQGFEPPAEVDDEVVVEVRIRATPDPLAVVAELNQALVAQQARNGVLTQQLETLTARLDRVEAAQAELVRELQALKAAGPSAGSVDVAKLPARFTDYVDYENERGADEVLDLGYQAEFEMVLIPGDQEKGVAPFYAQTTEVTWQMFRAWSYCTDLEDPSYAAKMKEQLLRPTPCYEDASRGHGFEGTAVLGVSRRNAEAFCKHVSELTGRPYRLWTDAEWRYVAEATGGVPKDLHAVAWLDGNCREDEWGAKMTMPVAKKPANTFGLYDFWGNVAEWVMDDEVFIRGGSYLVTKDELTMDWRETESQDIWNETYPNLPKSLWWYRDRFDMGFRLVCDPVNIPGAK
ncbi:MAG: SUMF1/EgtB/PvdO family nonheme iron enzyme [Planctomycetota bacterium]|nr:SUMF1/EgtB/PvdO family nonheme iron enzyme [Planctomycetota bacterium]